MQWAYWDRDTPADDWELRWFPSDNPDGDNQTDDSQMIANGVGPNQKFGVHFKMPDGTGIGDWHDVDELDFQSDDEFPVGFYPAGFKFTFTVHDSKGIIQGGRKFTHIVYLEN